MLLKSILTAIVALAVAQDTSTSTSESSSSESSSSSDSILSSSSTTALSTSNVASGGDYVTGTYVSYTSTVLLGGTSNIYIAAGPTLTRNASSPSPSVARLHNTSPCNGYSSFCNRKYSNITMVAAHNAPFRVRHNIASNQMFDLSTMLNDGIRMLQFQVHKPNDTSPLLLCHTSCDILNVGTLVDYLTTVRQWLERNPYDVITILMGNYDVLSPQNFVAPVVNSGLLEYAYTPPTVPMSLASWPTLGEMILSGKRVVFMLDYGADQTSIPWLLDEFGQMWETPFSSTNRDFICVVDRPPSQNRDESLDRMYMANHNLNVELSFGSFNLLVPAFPLLYETNAVAGYGSAGAQVTGCTSDWGRPPNFLLVDYYNLGNFNGSIFQVAADANGVSYSRNQCCIRGQRVFDGARSTTDSNPRWSIMLASIVSWLLYA